MINIDDYPALKGTCLQVAREKGFFKYEGATEEKFLAAMNESIRWYMTNADGAGHLMDREYGKPTEEDFKVLDDWAAELTNNEMRSFVGDKVDYFYLINEALWEKCPDKRLYELLTYNLSEAETALSGEE